MEAYQYDCASPDFEELARVISDLFPEQTQFIQRAADDGTPTLVIHWVAMRFGAAARRITMTRGDDAGGAGALSGDCRRGSAGAALRCCGRMSKRPSARSKSSMRTARRCRAK